MINIYIYKMVKNIYICLWERRKNHLELINPSRTGKSLSSENSGTPYISRRTETRGRIMRNGVRKADLSGIQMLIF